MKRIRLISVLLVVVMMLSLASCGKDKETSADIKNSDGSNKETTLKIMFFQNKPTGMEDVLEEFYKETKDTLNVKLDIEWVPGIMDLKDKVKLKMAAGEEYDLVWDAPSANMLTLIPQGAYVPLEEYFNNDKYPGLKKVFSEDFLEANKMSGHIYGVPLVNDWGMNVDGTVVRKDLREKYAPDGIKTPEEFTAFLEAIKENEPDLIPYAADGSSGLRQSLIQTAEAIDPLKSNIYSYSIGGWPFYFGLNEDKTGLSTPVVPLGAPGEQWEVFGKYNNLEDFYSRYNEYARLNPYLEKDVLAQKDRNALFYSGKAAMVSGDLGVFDSYITQMKERGYEVEWISFKQEINEMQPAAIESTFVARNFACVPVTSKKVDRVMEFLNWIFEDKSHHDLFELGIEGKNWEAVGDEMYKFPDDVDPTTNYNFPGYELTWTPEYVRYMEGTPEEIIDLRKYAADKESYVKSPLSGFFFENEPIKTELAQISSVGKELESPMLCGIYENPRDEWEKAYKKVEKIGLDKVREELEKQLTEFFDENK